MPWPGSPIFFSQKFDLINLLPRLGHSSLLNVSCAQILPRLGHSSLLNVSCAQILHKLSKTAQTSNTAAIEQRTRGAENTKRHKRATRHNWATRHKLSNTGAIEQRTRGAENARFSGLWSLRSYNVSRESWDWQQAGAELGQAQFNNEVVVKVRSWSCRCCWSSSTILDGRVRVELGNRNKLGLSCAILKVTYAVLIQ